MQFAIQIDDDSVEDDVEQMTADQIKRFKKKEKNSQKKKSKEKSRRKEVKRRSKSQKRRSSSSSQSSAQKKKKPKKVEKTKQKPKSTNMLLSEMGGSRWNRQFKQTQLIKFGHARMVKLGKAHPTNKLQQRARDVLKSGVTWWIQKGAYHVYGWKQIFFGMYEILARDIRIIKDDIPNLIRDIHHIRFNSVQILYLYKNNIRSIELMSRMRLPLLKDLSLRQNMITNIEPLGKMGLEKLQILSIYDNFIQDLSCLCQINTLSLKNLYIEFPNSMVMGEDISWMSKLKKQQKQLKTMELINIQSRGRINQKVVDQMLAQKYRVYFSQVIKRKL